MNEDKKNLNWRPAVQIFSQVSGWIVAPLVVALVFGKMLDARYGTEPVILLVFAGAGFLFTCFGIVRVIRKYIKEIKDLSDKK